MLKRNMMALDENKNLSASQSSSAELYKINAISKKCRKRIILNSECGVQTYVMFALWRISQEVGIKAKDK